MSVVIETTVGDIIVDLYIKERPNTCLNFLKLCKVKFYNLCVFYRIEKNFIAQTGDPTATGRGGESIFCRLYGDQAKYFDSEFKPRLKHEKLGTLSMVNNGNNMNGSQFFLTLSENLTYLDENHTVFGEVAEGFEVLHKLNDAICDNNNRPYQDIRITHTVILHDPFEDPKGLEIPEKSPEPTREMLDSNYIGADEEIDDNKGKTAEEVEEKIKESEAKARATILEMVGDIPDAEVKPPENVLFVCKLNPVTTSEDLEVIFSRFGKIMSCEVIKDKKTGESLQYAFIEFEREEDCEAAYFKMDNVLIDDRRIHVDFSQSVSKLYFNRGKLPNTKEFKSNFSLKNTDRKDGYDLIFESDGDNAADGKNRKAKSASKSKTSDKKSKHHSPSDEKRRTNREKERDHSSTDRRYKDSRSYRYASDSHSHREYSSSKGKESTKDISLKYKEEYSSYKSEGRESKQDRSRKDRDEGYADRKRDPYQKFGSKYSSENTSKSYRDSKYARQSSPERYYATQKMPSKRNRNDSPSPDHQPRKHHAPSRGESSDCYSQKKHSDRSHLEERDKKIKKGEAKSKDISKERTKSSSHKQKKIYRSEKAHSSKKSRSSSVSSSDSSSTSSSSSSSSSSASDSSSSSSNSDRKRRKHQHQKKEKHSKSHTKSKSHKVRKHHS